MPHINPSIQVTSLPSGAVVPVLGQGTWQLGEGGRPRAEEIAALRTGIDLGMTLIDTAEMYGNGASESLVGEAIAGRRDDIFLVTKVLPRNAGKRSAMAACEASLKRLRTDRIDLYLLHWPGNIPLADTVEAFRTLQDQCKIAGWGVSNFDLPDMKHLVQLVPADDETTVQTNQVLYNLTRRGIEFDLLPWCRQRGMPIMAYSPLEQGRLMAHKEITVLARRHNATEAQIALAWVLAQPGVIAIPRSGSSAHVRENQAAAGIRLTGEDVSELDAVFRAPARRVPLEVL
jgi:diketogulonate reductase-like aldo/keto reductase